PTCMAMTSFMMAVPVIRRGRACPRLGYRKAPRESAMSAHPDLTALVASADALFTALYDELHRMARRELNRRGGGVTLSATTLLHEAYLDISAREGAAFPD